jgi:hypothetical protein
MNIEQMIKLADLLDSRGEYDAAGEIDKLIKGAVKSCPHIGPGGSPEHIHDECQIEDDEPQIEEGEGPTEWERKNDPYYADRARYTEDLEKEFGSEDVARRQAEGMDKITEIIDSMGENKGSFLSELRQHVERLMDEKEPADPGDMTTISSVFQKLSKVADDLDGVGATKEADMIDSFLQKYAGEENWELENLPDRGEYNEQLRKQFEGEGEIEDEPEEEGWELENLPDRGEYNEQLREQFEDEEESEGLAPETEEEVDEIMRELEKLEGKRAELIGKLETPKKPKLSKRAEGYDEDRKEEGDTEQSKRYDSKHHHSLQIREPKGEQERVDREGRDKHHMETYQPHEGSLSTRYCPEHIGTMMGRVGPSVYQCPLDGQTYNWETGYTNFDGVNVPGGSVAAQTPDSTGYEVPHRVFDSREKTLNVVN